jgi:hypothetical protein
MYVISQLSPSLKISGLLDKSLYSTSFVLVSQKTKLHYNYFIKSEAFNRLDSW